MNEQLALTLSDPDADHIGQFHAPGSGAPATERDAAVLVTPRSGKGRRRVLDYLAGTGEHGATDEEGAAATGMRHYTYAPRRYELLHGGWVIDSGTRRRTSSGSLASVWVLSELGRSSWKAAS